MFPPDDPNTQPAPEEQSGTDQKNTQEQQVDAITKKRWAEFRQRIETTKMYRRKLVRNWSINIDFRRGKTFASQTDDDTMPVNLDWAYTKTKQAALFSQIPKARVSHFPESVEAGPWVSTFERALNDNIFKAGIESAMDELIPDCINAAGVGIALVAYEALTEQKQLPSYDLSVFPPEIQMQAMQTGQLFGNPIPMETVPQKVASRYTIRRISPADFLWPVDFTGSNFDNAPWLGYSGRLPWAEAAARFNLSEEDKQRVMTDARTVNDRLTNDIDKGKLDNDDKVGFDELFYHEFQYDSNAKSFDTIHHLVFLHGKNDPVIDQPWEGQAQDPHDPSKIVGSLKKPIRVLTLSYVTDEDIPPSDSAVGRSQVIELNKGRAHINKQRARNTPWTWFDVNRLDPAIQSALMRGVVNHAVPVQGDGSRIMGVVQQPTLGQENFTFDQIAKADLQEIWSIGPNQEGGGAGVGTAAEANDIQTNFQAKIGRERAKVASFFVGIAEVLGSLMCLYEDPTQFGQGFDPTVSQRLSYSILADSTVLVDSQQRLQRLNEFLNAYAKSGWVNIEPVLKEIATLVGLDPNTVVVPPQLPSPTPPNISLRMTGANDMMNPLLLAFMIKAGQAPSPDLVEKAKELIQTSVTAQQALPPPTYEPTMVRMNIDQTVPPPGQPGQPQIQGTGAPLPSGQLPTPPPVNIGEANPHMSAMPTIVKRTESGGKQ